MTKGMCESRSCGSCGAVFVPWNNNQFFCSDLCRFEIKVRRHAASDSDGCDLWAATRDSCGYGRFYVHGFLDGAHRFAWTLINGEIPEGMDVGHLCHDRAAANGACTRDQTCLHRACVRSSHLRPQTRRDNTLSSANTVASINAAKEFCPAGHPLVGDNLLPDKRHPDWRGWCRSCTQERFRVQQALHREAASLLGVSVSRYRREYGQSVGAAREIIARHRSV